MTLQVLPTRIYYPSTNLFTATASTILLDGDVDEIGMAFSFPKTGTCTGAAVTTGTVTTGELAVPFRVETIGADGNASGTLYHANATGTVDIADADDNVIKAPTFNGGTGFPCTVGDNAILRFKRNGTGSLVAQFRHASSFTNIGVASIPGVSDYNVTAGTTWTKVANAQPMLALNIGGWVAPGGCTGGITGVSATEAFQNDDERGILVNLPISARVVGVRFFGTIAAATTIKLSLYSAPAGTPVLEAETLEIDTDVFQTGAGNRVMEVFFTTPETLAANTDYVVALSPQGATNVNLPYFPSNNTYAAAYPTGSTGVWQARSNVGDAFVPNTGRIPPMSLIIDAIDSGSTKPPFIIGG